MRRRVPGLLALALLLGCGGPARAEPIRFTFQGTGTGDVSGTPFAGAAFTITVFADTDELGFLFGHPLAPMTESSPTSIEIAGVGKGLFSTGKRVVNNQMISVLALFSYETYDLIDVSHPDFTSYALDTSFGPVFDPEPGAVFQFHDVPADFGVVTFTDIRDVTFLATLGPPNEPVATKPAVPEPAGLVLLGGGAAGVLGYACRRRRSKSGQAGRLSTVRGQGTGLRPGEVVGRRPRRHG